MTEVHAVTDAKGMTFIEFLDAKWGDIISLLILASGLIMMKYNQPVIGMTFIGSGLTGLKLKSNGVKTNGATQVNGGAAGTRVA